MGPPEYDMIGIVLKRSRVHRVPYMIVTVWEVPGVLSDIWGTARADNYRNHIKEATTSRLVALVVRWCT